MSNIIKFPNRKPLLKRFLDWLNEPRVVTFDFPITTKNEIFNKKIQTLHDEVYKYFLDLHTMRIGKVLDLHPDYYAKEDAKKYIQENILLGKINFLHEKRQRFANSNGMKF